MRGVAPHHPRVLRLVVVGGGNGHPGTVAAMPWQPDTEPPGHHVEAPGVSSDLTERLRSRPHPSARAGVRMGIRLPDMLCRLTYADQGHSGRREANPAQCNAK